MHPDLQMLMKLQVIDYDLGELERSKDYLPDMMENLRHEIKEAETKLADTRQQLDAAKVKQKKLELEIESREAELQKYQQQMMSIKTNREYDALVAEIDGIKERISSCETDLLETIDLISQLETDITQFSEKEKQVSESNTRQLQILQEKVDSIGAKVSGKVEMRQGIITSIPKTTLSIYERVRRGRRGRAVVGVRKRACGACFKALTAKKIQEIKRAERIHACDNCGAMLYWDNDESN